MNKPRTTKEEFLKRAKEIHGDTYDYSKVVYNRVMDKVIITCKKHGDFYQIANNHIRGKGCKKCLNFSMEEFLEKAFAVHGNKYTYSKTVYKNIKTKVIITCPNHGDFSQQPHHHLLGNGCRECSFDRKRSTFQEVISKANKIHNNYYSYDTEGLKYTNDRQKINIICPKHGKFQQSITSHISRTAGCPKCSHRISDPEKDWLDYMNIPDDKEHRQVKISVNTKSRFYIVDGFLPETNTIYEFLGDYFHGNLELYNEDTINERTKTTFRELYDKTREKVETLTNLGYNVVVIWESMWKKQSPNQ
jgi:hypothetical protein